MITVLYEDSRAAGASQFGPHELLLHCVAERLGLTRYDRRLSDIRHVAKRGNDKLVADLQPPYIDDLARRTSMIVAVLDSDDIRKLTRDPEFPMSNCTGPAIRRARSLIAPTHDQLVIWFIEFNTETLTNEAARALRRPVSGKPRPKDRDGLLIPAAHDPGARAAILGAVPSFAKLVEKVAALVP